MRADQWPPIGFHRARSGNPEGEPPDANEQTGALQAVNYIFLQSIEKTKFEN